MKIATVNVNGIREAVSRGFLDWLASQDADVVCIQNLKAKSFELDDSILYPEGYEGYFLDAEKDGFSGVGLYCRQIPKAIMYGLVFEQCDNEGRYLQADYDRFSICSFLMPDGSDPAAKGAFMEQYQEYLSKLRRKRRDYMICGTWHVAHKTVDLANWSDNQMTPGFKPEERAWMDQVFGPIGFIDAFRDLERVEHGQPAFGCHQHGEPQRLQTLHKLLMVLPVPTKHNDHRFPFPPLSRCARLLHLRIFHR
mgnify:CR=1 FL=1